MGILLLLVVLCILCNQKKTERMHEDISCIHNEHTMQIERDSEMERQERAQYYREYESRGRQKYYHIPCPWKKEDENQGKE